MKNIKNKLESLNLSDLKWICKYLGKTCSGNKKQLINRLLEPFKYTYKMNNLLMTNGYSSNFPNYLLNYTSYTELFFREDIKKLLSNGMQSDRNPYEIKSINIDKKFVGLNYQPEGSHDLCWAYAIMSYLNKDGELRPGEYEINSLTALKWIQTLPLSLDDSNILKQLIVNTSLFNYWYDSTLEPNDEYETYIPNIQELFNRLPEIITEYFNIKLYPRLPYISNNLSFDDIILNVIFDSNIKKASRFFANIILSGKYGIDDFIHLLSAKKREGAEKQMEMIEYLETELTEIDIDNKDSLSAFIYDKILEYSPGIEENIDGIIPVGSDDSSVHYYSIRNCKNNMCKQFTSYFTQFIY